MIPNKLLGICLAIFDYEKFPDKLTVEYKGLSLLKTPTMIESFWYGKRIMDGRIVLTPPEIQHFKKIIKELNKKYDFIDYANFEREMLGYD